MRNLNAREEQFELIELFDKPALFTNNRIDRDTVPDDYHVYDIRGNDDDGYLYSLEDRVIVNHSGTVISNTKFEYPDNQNYLVIVDDIGFTGEQLTLVEYIDRCIKSEYPNLITPIIF